MKTLLKTTTTFAFLIMLTLPLGGCFTDGAKVLDQKEVSQEAKIPALKQESLTSTPVDTELQKAKVPESSGNFTMAFDPAIDIELQKKDAAKMMASAKTLKEWQLVFFAVYRGAFDSTPSDIESYQKIFAKMMELATTFEDWQVVRNTANPGGHGGDPTTVDIELDKISKTAVTKMTELAKTIEDWRNVYDYAYADMELQEKAATKMAQLMADSAKTLKEWQAVYNTAPIGSDLRKRALTKMAQFE